MLEWSATDTPRSVLDVGCGIGGTSRYLAKTYPGAQVTGITLSPNQVKRATELAKERSLTNVDFKVMNALEMDYPDDSFDLVWACESGEHMPDKAKFVGELCRVTAPGGRVIIATWCHRVLGPGEDRLQDDEEALLRRINKAYFLPQWCSIKTYQDLFEEAGLQDIKVADWSAEVSPFWGAVIRSALSVEGVMGLLTTGWSTIQGALVMPLMAEGLRKGTIKFALITAVKSSNQ